MKWQVFNTHTGDTICSVPFKWLAKQLCKVDKTWDYDDMKKETTQLGFWDEDQLRKIGEQYDREESNGQTK